MSVLFNENLVDNLNKWRTDLSKKFITILDLLINIVRILQWNEAGRIEAMKIVVDLLEPLLVDSDWIDGDVPGSEFDTDNPEESFQFISGVYRYLFQKICRHLSDDEVCIPRSDLQTVKDKIADPRITDKMLLNPWQLAELYQAIDGQLQDEDFTPHDAITLIGNHWEQIYMDRPVYEALEYTLKASDRIDFESLTEEEITGFLEKLFKAFSVEKAGDSYE